MYFGNLRISVIIPNYNYSEFVGDAVRSALQLDWPHKEIIVVDDGSTDSSREVIGAFVPLGVRAIYKQNGGQASACSVGYAESSGDLVYFLDSDDVVHPDMMRRLASYWRPGVSKFQFPMVFVDSKGQPSGGVLPKFKGVPTPEQIRLWYARTGFYPTPPGSGNVYMRSFLEQIMPLEPGVDTASDSYMIYAAPFFGDVITVPHPLVDYRVHSGNQGSMSVLRTERFAKELERDMRCRSYGARLAARVGARWFSETTPVDLKILALRTSSYILDRPHHPIRGDSRKKILRDLFRSMRVEQGYSAKSQIVLSLFLLAVILLPPSVGQILVSLRYVRDSRPVWFQKLVTKM